MPAKKTTTAKVTAAPPADLNGKRPTTVVATDEPMPSDLDLLIAEATGTPSEGVLNDDGSATIPMRDRDLTVRPVRKWPLSATDDHMNGRLWPMLSKVLDEASWKLLASWDPEVEEAARFVAAWERLVGLRPGE